MPQQQPEQRGLNIGIGDTQAIVVQLGRIADALQKLADFYTTNPPVKPQPFSGNVG